ncbi:iron chelate uptake ABC transporter family permease subunit [[Mycoplasma] testudinis]|uniref:iron chelate uptake ABC transporter family permease subunit n=1 Tax=[Mycoplasma] testudinis TaxID=33924 RepID=UPI00146FB342|nr:iron chelate uptake ABC transporter family permease subunit [[Mycoplasma] testudinis]
MLILTLTLSLILLFFYTDPVGLRLPLNNNYLIWKLKSQSLLKTWISGIAIGLSNYLLQFLTRNKLADTSIFGINSFQQIAVALFVLLSANFFLANEQTYIFGFIYLGIGLISGILFYLISNKNHLTSRAVIIYGIVLNVFLSAFAFFILSSDGIRINFQNVRFANYFNKVFGGIQVSFDFSGIIFSIILLFVCLVSTLILRIKIIAQASAIQKQNTLGLKPQKIRFSLVILISILGSIIFANIGFVAFVGVVISLISNRLFNNFNNRVFSSMTISIIFILISQIIQIGFTQIAGLSISVIISIISFPIFIIFVIIKD